MKIIIIGTVHPYRGGLAAFNERLAREFLKEGHEVEVYTFTLQYPSFLFPGKTQFSDEPAPEGLKIFRKINSINPFSWLKVGRSIRRKKPDLAIFCYWMSFMSPCFGTIARQIRKDSSITQLGLIHNMIPHEPNVLDRLLPSYFVNTMNGFVTLSKSVIQDVDKFDKHSSPKLFSPHPIYDHYGEIMARETALQHLKLPTNKEYVLFFGFIRSYKGLDLLLDAFADERLKNMNVELIIAGEFYQDASVYTEQIERLGIANKVHLHTDFIPDSKVNQYFSACDIVVQPYKSATQSGVTQIAYYFDKPMLVTNVGGLPEIVPHGKVGYVVAPSPEEIADALVDFFENSKSGTFVENVKVEKEKYSWTKMLETIYKFIQ
jgi:glycosyltransferase involved in cell wall biosynthesis